MGVMPGKRGFRSGRRCILSKSSCDRASGYQPPYVEKDAATALSCLNISLPVGICLGVGALIRLAGNAVGLTGRPAVTPSKRPAFRRFTVLRLMVVVAVIALHLAFVRLLIQNDPFFGFCTFYSERYSESRFNSLRAGMTCEEVEASMGRPLRRQPWSRPDELPKCEMWQFSDRLDYTANYWRRWVLFEDGKVSVVISDFWFD